MYIIYIYINLYIYIYLYKICKYVNICLCNILEKIAPSKISAAHQISFAELMSIVRQTKILSFILG